MSARTLADDVDALKALLDAHAAKPDGPAARRLKREAADLAPSTPLAALAEAFGLSSFERWVLLLAAAVEMDGAVPSLCARAQGASDRTFATFSLALAALPEPAWTALSPAGPLRTWDLVRLPGGRSPTTDPLAIDEHVLYHLVGVAGADPRLAATVREVPPAAPPVPSQHPIVEGVLAAWRGAFPLAPVQLVGSHPQEARALARSACDAAGLRLFEADAALLPTQPAEVDAFARVWVRESILTSSALLIDAHGLAAHDPTRAAVLSRVAERVPGPVVLAAREALPLGGRPTRILHVERPTVEEQLALWASLVPEAEAEAIASQFDLPAVLIREAGRAASAAPGGAWEACRSVARPALDQMATRVEPRVGLADVVLPAPQKAALRALVVQARLRAKVHARWGFARVSSRGLGVSALFAGPSGTGKTMAAEAIARELRLDLYRVDLSQVVDKYVGETEKNLRRVFDAAEAGGAVLFFDEADALFGRRSEVKDSHDRFANQEVSYLLQRVESHRGVSILATNLREALDPAFLRRLGIVVSFPFPDAAARAEMWRRAFPPQAPTEGLRPEDLARLSLTGGSIRSVAMQAAYLAAEEDAPIRPAHVLAAAKAEMAKQDRPLLDVEVGGWS